MFYAIFTQDGSKERCTGYTTVSYSSGEDSETVVETTKNDLAAVFEDANSSGEALDGADASIGAAVDDPLSFMDYLVLDSNDSIAFDPDHVRQSPDKTTSA